MLIMTIINFFCQKIFSVPFAFSPCCSLDNYRVFKWLVRSCRFFFFPGGKWAIIYCEMNCPGDRERWGSVISVVLFPSSSAFPGVQSMSKKKRKSIAKTSLLGLLFSVEDTSDYLKASSLHSFPSFPQRIVFSSQDGEGGIPQKAVINSWPSARAKKK